MPEYPRAGGINSRPAQVSALQRQFLLCGGAGRILYPRYAAYLGRWGATILKSGIILAFACLERVWGREGAYNAKFGWG